jgi:predicted nucleotidyltransferase
MTKRYRNKLIEVYNYLQEQGFEPIYIALYGSQNYELDDENSDFDYKAFVKPTRIQVYRGDMTLKTLEYQRGQIEVRDFRLITDQLGRMNPHFIELFATSNHWVDGYYAQHFHRIRELIKELLKDRFVLFTRACCGACVDAYNKMLTEDGYNPKKLYTIARLYHLYNNVCDCKGFVLVNTGTTQHLLKDLKAGKCKKEEAMELAQYYVSLMKREKKEVEEQSNYITDHSLNQVEEMLIDLFSLIY